MKLNLGCGMRYLDGYVNADFSDKGSNGSTIKVDEKYNFLEGLPYEDNSVEEIVFTDVLEHFNRWNGLKILKEIFRVLKPGGNIVITVPNAIAQMRRFIDEASRLNDSLNINDFIEAHSRCTFWKWHDDVSGATHESDGFDGDSHKTFYTPKTLESILKHVGFQIISIHHDVIKIVATK